MRINRLPSSGHTTPSPPASPRRSPRYRHGRGKPGGRFTPVGPPGRANLAHRLAWLFLSVLLRRQGIFLFAPLIYISGMLLYMGTVSFDVVPVIKHRPAPGSVYRSPQVYAKLKPEMDADNSSSDAVRFFLFSYFLFDEFFDCCMYLWFIYFLVPIWGEHSMCVVICFVDILMNHCGFCCFGSLSLVDFVCF